MNQFRFWQFFMFLSISSGVYASAVTAHQPVHHINSDKAFLKLDATQSTSFLFSKFMGELSSASKQQNDHAAYARVYFDRLYSTGTSELKKALADMTLRLGNMFDSTFWSGHKKDVAMSMLLRHHFAVITKALTRPEQKQHAYKLHKHIQAALTPAIHGLKQHIKRVPWMRLAMTAALLGGGAYALRHDTFKKAGDVMGAGHRILRQVKHDYDEGMRHTQAFMRTVIHQDKNGTKYTYNANSDTWAAVGESGTTKPITQLSPIERSKNGKVEYLVDLDPERWLSRKTGTIERLTDVLESVTPILKDVGRNMEHSAKVSEEWFKEHEIIKQSGPNGFYRMVRVHIPETPDTQASYELRYLSSKTTAETDQSKLDAMHIWTDPQSGTKHFTYLPNRNPLELIGDALGSKPVQSLVSGIGDQMDVSKKNNMHWLYSNGLITNPNDPTSFADDAQIKFDEERNMYYHKDGQDFKPGLDVIAKLSPALEAISNPNSGPGKLVMAIGQSIHGGNNNFARWLYSNGITTNKADPTSWKPGVKRMYDPQTKHGYYLVPNEDGTKRRVEDNVASIDRLFDAIGELATPNSNAPLSKLAEHIGHVLSNIDGIIGSIKRDTRFAVTASNTDKQAAARYEAGVRALSRQKDLANLERLQTPKVQAKMRDDLASITRIHSQAQTALDLVQRSQPRNKNLEVKLRNKLKELVSLRTELEADIRMAGPQAPTE